MQRTDVALCLVGQTTGSGEAGRIAFFFLFLSLDVFFCGSKVECEGRDKDKRANKPRLAKVTVRTRLAEIEAPQDQCSNRTVSSSDQCFIALGLGDR